MELSVIIPIYNVVPFLKKAVEDLANQTFLRNRNDTMEIILVNDASTDSSLALAEDLRKQNRNLIRIIDLPENHGPGGARNYGIEAAKGDYIGFMDADDRIDSGMYEKLMKAARESGQKDYADCGVFNEADQTTRCYSAVTEPGILDDRKKSQLLLAVGYIWSRVYRRAFLINNGIRFREHAVMEDQDFLSEVIARARSMAMVPEVLYRYSDIPGSASKKDAEVEFFHSTIETIQATYAKLSVLDNYKGIQMAVEYNFWQLYLMNVQTIKAYYEAGIIDSNIRVEMLTIIGKMMAKTIKIRAEDNQFVVKKIQFEDIDLIKQIMGM